MDDSLSIGFVADQGLGTPDLLAGPVGPGAVASQQSYDDWLNRKYGEDVLGAFEFTDWFVREYDTDQQDDITRHFCGEPEWTPAFA